MLGACSWWAATINAFVPDDVLSLLTKSMLPIGWPCSTKPSVLVNLILFSVADIVTRLAIELKVRGTEIV